MDYNNIINMMNIKRASVLPFIRPQRISLACQPELPGSALTLSDEPNHDNTIDTHEEDKDKWNADDTD